MWILRLALTVLLFTLKPWIITPTYSHLQLLMWGNLGASKCDLIRPELIERGDELYYFKT